jgi:tetratricopeptide (TPR) repeat protein
VKRTFAIAALILVVAAGVVLVEHAAAERRYAGLLRAGQHALDAGNGYAAIEAFTGAVTLRPDSMAAYYRRGQAYRAEGREEEAARDFRMAIRLAPEAPQPRIALGDMYETSDPAQAASWYGEAAAQLKSDDPTFLYKLALARYRAGTPAEAVAPLQHVLARNDSLAEAHYLLGLVYRDLQRLGESTASLERAVKLAPGLIPARDELANAYGTLGRHVDEMTQLQALAVLEDSTDRVVRIGLAEAGQGQFPDALATLSAAAARAPGDSRLQLALGRVYLARAERTDDREAVSLAVESLERALGGTARRGEGLALFGRALSLSGDQAGAERILREAVATSPVAPEAFGYLAEACERLNHFQEARDALATLDVLEGDTASAEARAARAQRLGTLSLKAHDVPAALNYLGQAVAAGHRTGATLAALAEARFETGDSAGAHDAIEEGLSLEPRNPELLRLKRRR